MAILNTYIKENINIEGQPVEVGLVYHTKRILEMLHITLFNTSYSKRLL